MVDPIPPGYQTVVPSIVVKGTEEFMGFLATAFGATERMRFPMPDGTIAHAEVQIGDSVVMTAEATEQWGESPSSLHMWVPDVDQAYKRALDAGATSEMEPADQFYGDRSATVRDKWGNRWSLSAHVEDVSDEEMERRMADFASSMQAQ